MVLMRDNDWEILYKDKIYLVDGLNIVVNTLKIHITNIKKSWKYYHSTTRIEPYYNETEITVTKLRNAKAPVRSQENKERGDKVKKYIQYVSIKIWEKRKYQKNGVQYVTITAQILNYAVHIKCLQIYYTEH